MFVPAHPPHPIRVLVLLQCVSIFSMLQPWCQAHARVPATYYPALLSLVPSSLVITCLLLCLPAYYSLCALDTLYCLSHYKFNSPLFTITICAVAITVFYTYAFTIHVLFYIGIIVLALLFNCIAFAYSIHLSCPSYTDRTRQDGQVWTVLFLVVGVGLVLVWRGVWLAAGRVTGG